MTYHFDPEALDEYIDAIEYYRKVNRQLAHAFVVEVERGIASILENPTAYPVVEQDVRRLVTRRFPFGIFYTIESDGNIWVVAVGHLKRHFGYWRDRVP